MFVFNLTDTWGHVLEIAPVANWLTIELNIGWKLQAILEKNENLLEHLLNITVKYNPYFYWHYKLSTLTTQEEILPIILLV